MSETTAAELAAQWLARHGADEEGPPDTVTDGELETGCPFCDDVGMYILEAAGAQAVRRYCECEAGRKLKRERAEELLALFSPPSLLETATFDTYAALSLSSGQRVALQKARRFARNGVLEYRGRDRMGLFFYGDVGRGKTGLAVATARDWIERHVKAALYTTVPDLLDHLRATFGPDSTISYDQLFDSYRIVPLLVLDDLGAELSTPWAMEKLYLLINGRYESRKSLIVTSNRSPGELMAYFDRAGDWTGKRIVDRLTAMCAPIDVSGKNLRG